MKEAVRRVVVWVTFMSLLNGVVMGAFHNFEGHSSSSDSSSSSSLSTPQHHLSTRTLTTDSFLHVPQWPRTHQALEGQGPIGQVSGVAIDWPANSDDVWIFARRDRIWDSYSFDDFNVIQYDTPIHGATLIKLSGTTGEIVSMFGERTFYMPHGLTIDHDGNIWVTDVGRHQVFKYTQTGQLLLTVGMDRIPGYDRRKFCKPTDVAVRRDGSFYVADGYCNSRIVYFDAHGRYIAQWGSFGSRPNSLTFYVPHSIKLDEARNILYVADRENGRIQMLNAINGTYMGQWMHSSFQKVFAIDMKPSATSNTLCMVNGALDTNKSGVKGFEIGLSGAQRGKVTGHFASQHQLLQPHDVDVSANGNTLYVADIERNAVLKFMR